MILISTNITTANIEIIPKKNTKPMNRPSNAPILISVGFVGLTLICFLKNLLFS